MKYQTWRGCSKKFLKTHRKYKSRRGKIIRVTFHLHPPRHSLRQAKQAREEAEGVNIKRKTSQEAAERTLWNLARKRSEGFDKNMQIQLACEGLRVEVKRLKTLAEAAAAKVPPAWTRKYIYRSECEAAEACERHSNIVNRYPRSWHTILLPGCAPPSTVQGVGCRSWKRGKDVGTAGMSKP